LDQGLVEGLRDAEVKRKLLSVRAKFSLLFHAAIPSSQSSRDLALVSRAI
jgi:hypothetical protein